MKISKFFLITALLLSSQANAMLRVGAARLSFVVKGRTALNKTRGVKTVPTVSNEEKKFSLLDITKAIKKQTESIERQNKTFKSILTYINVGIGMYFGKCAADLYLQK